MRRWVTAIGAVVGGALLAAVAVVSVRRSRQLRLVPRDLRHALILPPLSVTNRLFVLLGRRFAWGGDDMLRYRDVSRVEVHGGLDAYLHDPEDRTRPGAAVLWLHGGGLIGGRPELEQRTARRISAELGVLVVNARYRLAPEHPFPAALDDVFATLRWMHDSADALGIDPTRIVVAGESAGAGLAAAVAQRAHDEGVPVAFQALVYPMLDDRTALLHDHAHRGKFIWTAASNRYAWTAYLGRSPTAAAPAPYAAAGRREDLRGLPPAWIGVGDLDLFCHEDLEYARRLREAGVEVDVVHIPGMYHGADELASHVPEMRAFRRSMLDAIRRAVL